MKFDKINYKEDDNTQGDFVINPSVINNINQTKKYRRCDR